MIRMIEKRDGRSEPFNRAKIEEVVFRAVLESTTYAAGNARAVALLVAGHVEKALEAVRVERGLPEDDREAMFPVETIQDRVEEALMQAHLYDTARHYILHRNKRRARREERPVDPAHAARVAADQALLPEPIQLYQHQSKYARWIESEGRRELWSETVDRAMGAFREMGGELIPEAVYTELAGALRRQEALPSMRLLQMAGPAMDRCNVCAYNCGYVPIDSLFAYAELLYVMMQGTGIGFSVERQYIDRLPRVKRQKARGALPVHVISDDTVGWCLALSAGLTAWWAGKDILFDYSRIRPAGSRLLTKGGRACLTADSEVYLDKPNRWRRANSITVGALYRRFTHRSPDGRRSGSAKKTKVRCLDERTGTFFRNKVTDVIDNGTASVYRIVTENGYTIKATANHRFMDSRRCYRSLETFSPGELIALNGRELKTASCQNCGTAISRRAARCKPCQDEQHKQASCSNNSARGRKQCREYADEVGSCEACGAQETRLTVHQIDGEPRNNDWTNLQKLCEPCHQGLHAIQRAGGDPYRQTWVTFEPIASIEYVGEEQVYDLSMEGPNHNFVANGFVSHNSGPEPLKELLDFARTLVLSRQDGRLSSADAHRLACMCGRIVQVGGVRRAAQISLSDLDDLEMRDLKTGAFWETMPELSQANNSAVYDEAPTAVEFMEEWLALAKSGSGERGIFNREGLIHQRPARRKTAEFGCNPCAEISLRPRQFCNLSISVARPDDTPATLAAKVRQATIFGTLQSTLTHFEFLPEAWRKNCEEERLLGVDITGQMDCPLLQPGNPDREALLIHLREVATETNREFAALLGINPSAAITCVKPSGNSAWLLFCGSGLHAWWSPYFIRRTEASRIDPLTQMLMDAGVPWQPKPGDDPQHPATVLFEWPIKAPEGAITRAQMTSVEQFDNWLIWKTRWSDHNPSTTIYVGADEWFALGERVFTNWDWVGGLAFLPRSDHQYRLAPYEEITAEEHAERVARFPRIDWAKLPQYEQGDTTTGSQEFACLGSSCDISL